MRLHHLTVSAFGPFAGTEHVDFDALSTAGIFLFSGATGAGKTSVLDAVCFGLYGQVPGARARARSVRSDHAAPAVRPEVALELTLRGRRLRITRSPQWDRPKRRGTGMTVEQARVLVEELGPEGWQTLSTRLDEAGHLLGGLLGLTLAQFCQVVLLPQGQFAEFLRADADKRRALLESLFDTSRFAAVEGWLVARRQGTWRALEAADQSIGRLLARVAQAAGSDLPDDRSPDASTGWVEQLLAAATEEQATAARVEQQASAAATAALDVVGSAEKVAALQERSVALTARRSALVEAKHQRDDAVAELAAARKAAPLMPLLAEVARLQDELTQVHAMAASSAAVLAPVLAATGTDSSGGSAFPPAARVSSVSRATRDEVGRLRHLLGKEQEADELSRSIDDLHRRSVELSTLSDEAAAWLARAGDRRLALSAARDDARTAEAGQAEARAASDRAGARLIAASRRDELTSEVTLARDRLRVLVDAHQVAVGELQRIRAARLAGMAAELAGGLAEGHDCPVCGSVEHPRPASAAEVVTRDDEEAAADRAAVAEAERHECAETVAAMDVELAAQLSAAGGDATVEALRDEHQALQVLAARVAALAAMLPSAQLALDTFDQERESWVRRRVGLDEEAKAIADRVTEHQQRATSMLEELTAARGDDPTVAARAARLQRLADALDGLARHLSGVERLDGEVASALDRLEVALSERGFDSLDDVLAAIRDEARCAALDEIRQRHDTELATVVEQLGDPDLVAAVDDPAPDLELLRRSAREAEGQRDGAVAAAAEARTRAMALRRLSTALTAELAERAPLAEAHRVIDGLSRLAEGKSSDNRLRMSLSAYVLAARLEQVALSASERLFRMSSGRYTLLHTAEGGTGRARGGLALRVLDAWTGQERDPATLSGGEGFSASLALALGLADVVTAEAGGAVLETLFVDEGFGSLDDETLDEVMTVLDDLRDGGRTVGVVSHVADLRQRIPTQLRVDKTRSGSTLHQ